MEEVAEARRLARLGFGASEIARRTGIPRSTVRDWLLERTRSDSSTRAAAFDPSKLSASYPYLLGMYLGDGCLSVHPRGVWRLRISLDRRYPGIIEECRQAVAEATRSTISHLIYWRSSRGVATCWAFGTPGHRTPSTSRARTTWRRWTS
jgi:hypothetical protein